MEKADPRGEERLKRYILSQIDEKGPIPFSQFMEWCLYHPEYGYYRSPERTIGKEGDYYTSPCVHPLFGRLIGKQLSQMSEILGGGTFDVVEMGAGRGFLCEDILDWMETNSLPRYRFLRYHLLETAPHFLREQKERLDRRQREGKVLWTDPEAFEEGKIQIQGCFLSNELVDAFPVHRVLFEQGSLKEAYVTHRNGQLEERWGELSDPRLSDHFRSLEITLREGQKAEVNLKALEWMEKVGRSLQRGFVLTIDYGYPSHELYASHRREGTLLCYHRHQLSDNPFERLGEQDITSHVNFTGLIRKGEDVGLHLTGLVPQYQFLIGLGILQEMESLGGRLSEENGLRFRLSVKHLIEPVAGMGEVFKVLVQHKGIETPRLDGLRDFRSIPWSA